MAEATKNPGLPARTTKHAVTILRTSDLRREDVVTIDDRNAFYPKVERTVEHPATPDTYTLELSEDEVQFLADLTYKIGGDPSRSRRKFADRLGEALALVGVAPLAGEYDRFGHRIPDLKRTPAFRFADGPDNPYTES